MLNFCSLPRTTKILIVYPGLHFIYFAIRTKYLECVLNFCSRPRTTKILTQKFYIEDFLIGKEIGLNYSSLFSTYILAEVLHTVLNFMIVKTSCVETKQAFFFNIFLLYEQLLGKQGQTNLGRYFEQNSQCTN